MYTIFICSIALSCDDDDDDDDDNDDEYYTTAKKLKTAKSNR